MIEKIAYIGPGGPEFVVLLLVVLLLFGAKDAPRVLRKMNETYHKLRKKIDKFKREIMYGDRRRHAHFRARPNGRPYHHHTRPDSANDGKVTREDQILPATRKREEDENQDS